jgi:hypothetical protein
MPMVLPNLGYEYYQRNYVIINKIATGGQGRVFIVLDITTGTYRIAKVNMNDYKD